MHDAAVVRVLERRRDLLGDRARAMDEIERAYAADSQMLAWLGQDRLFDPLRTEPRFIDFLKRIGFGEAR